MIEPVARILLGEPNRVLSSKTELRYGSRGSVSVDLRKGTWFDHETNEGGGTLDLITRQTGLREAERFEWLERNTDYESEPRTNGHDRGAPKLGVVVATYPYVDEAAEFLFEVVRFEPKDFRQRRRARPDDDPTKIRDGWVWSSKGVRQVPYRLPEIIEAIASERTIFVVEGEKDADNLWKIGVPATCNAGGAGKWRGDLDQFFEGADVVVVPDYDPQKLHPKTKEPMFHDDGRPILPGQDHAQDVARHLSPAARSVRVLELWQSWRQMPLKGDASDWIKAGGTADQLYALVEGLRDWSPTDKPSEQVVPITLTFPFPINGATIPRRPWIVPGLLLRRQVTVMVAPPGSGKSLLTVQLGIVCAAGVTTWPWRPRGRFRVLIINAEEDEDELRRRLYAARDHMRIPDNHLIGLAFANETESIVVAKADAKTKTVTRTPMLERIVATVIDQAFDIVIVDPFAETFAGDENSNSELKWAAVLWREVARRTNAAIFLVHHTRKYAHDMAGDPDAGRGAGALTGVARIVATLFTMTEKEAERLIPKRPIEDRVKYIRFDDAKANLNLLTINARWFEKITVRLPNSGEDEPADEVGVLTPWTPPDPIAGLDPQTAIAILKQIDGGYLDKDGNATGDLFTLSKAGAKNDRWAGFVVHQFLDCDDATAKKLLQRWLQNNFIKEVTEPSKKGKGSSRKGLRVIGYPGVTEEARLGQGSLELHP
jgi:hypothetical protein